MAHEFNLKKLYGAPEWIDDAFMRSSDIGSGLSAGLVYSVANLVQGASEALPIGKAPTYFFEFGSGYGEGLIALDMLAHSFHPPAQVLGSEIAAGKARCAQTLTQICRHMIGIETDGIQTLRQNPHSFDIVVAHLLGHHDTPAEFAETFLSAAIGATKKGGVIAISSDAHTMTTVTAIAEGKDIGTSRFVPDARLIPRGFRVNPRLYVEA